MLYTLPALVRRILLYCYRFIDRIGNGTPTHLLIARSRMANCDVTGRSISLYFNFSIFSSIRALCSRLLKINSERIKQADSLSSRINEMLKLSFDPDSRQSRSDDMKIKVYQFLIFYFSAYC